MPTAWQQISLAECQAAHPWVLTMAYQASGFYTTKQIETMDAHDEQVLVQKYTKMLRMGVPKQQVTLPARRQPRPPTTNSTRLTSTQIEREMSTRGLDTSTVGRIVKQVLVS